MLSQRLGGYAIINITRGNLKVNLFLELTIRELGTNRGLKIKNPPEVSMLAQRLGGYADFNITR